jgi:hypothetical protein
LLRGLWPALERYRFVRALAGEPVDPDDERDGDGVMYEALPALHHYDVRRLGPTVLARAFADPHESPEDAAGPGAPP